MKILYLFLCCFLLAITIQCQKNTFQESPIAGTWVETTSNSDTLEFLPEYDGQYPVFWLKRGKNNDGLPKNYSGPYSYKISENFISINWFLSSNAEFHRYLFELSPNKEILKIGDFFDHTSLNEDTLVFKILY